ncbi:general secretion pathway protein GspB [Hydrogenophaga sp.]|uniref:general secretion pathway protein GspB n=1 Tax=Hydrogenophaga sp. TaxID=1904254 RepID=UPI00272FC09E|nr:general secretion pathway protein GspB [Hydrogenophaga sp.]MDP1684935.1 general secretion pathway protein GspB [Hydrogenophaga sp.]
MSYILDALQRAEAERERGRVPGLKSQLVPPARAERPARNGLRPWHALPVLAALALGIWWWTGSADTAPAPAVEATALKPAPAPAAPPAPPAVQPAPPPPASPPERLAAPALPILAPPRAPAVTAKAAAPVTAATATPPATPSAAAPAPTPESTASPNAAVPVAKSPSAPAAGAVVPGFGELSPEARAQLPAVNISGSTYSKNPALRMLIANGKVVYEGQDIAPGLRLETIGARSAVLNHQGLRYSIGY